MRIMSPAFREINFAKIETLSRHFSGSMIAAMVSDKTGADVSPAEISAYQKINRLASNVMLVTKAAVDFAAPEVAG